MKVLDYIKTNYWLLAILVLASFLRLFHLDFQSVWMDEIYTLNITNPSLTWSQLHHEIVEKEGFPYLYFLLLRGFYAVLGYSEAVARLLSVLGGIAGVGAIYIFGKNIFNKQVGLIAAFLLAINEFHIAASQEARPYSLFVLFALIAFYRLSVFIKAQTFKNALWFGLAAGLMLNINFFALITLLCQALLLLIIILFSPKENRIKLLIYSLLAGIIALLLLLPNYEILSKLMGYESFWVPFPQEDSFSKMFSEFLGNNEIIRFIFLSIILYYMVVLFKEKIDRNRLMTIKDYPMNYSFLILFVWFLGYSGFLYIKSFSATSLILSRYFITIIPVILLIAAIGIYSIKSSIAKAAIVLCILMFSLFNLITVKEYYTKVIKTQFREMAAFVAANNKTNIQAYSNRSYWYAYFFNKEKSHANVIQSTLEAHISEMRSDSTKRKPFWYVEAHSSPYQVSGEGEKYLEEYFYIDKKMEGFDAWTRFYNLKTNKQKIDITKLNKLKQSSENILTYNIEIVENNNGKLKFSGWGYINDQDANNTRIEILLVKDDVVKQLSTLSIARPDITNYYKLNYKLVFNVDHCGFFCEYDSAALEPGNYKIGIYMIDTVSNKEALGVTDKNITK